MVRTCAIMDWCRSGLIGSSEKFVSGMMKAEESKNEVAFVAQTVGLAQECFNLIVDALHAAVVDPVFPPRKYPASILLCYSQTRKMK